MRVFTGKLYKRVSLFALSFILAVSSLSAATSLYFSQAAYAAGALWSVDSFLADDSQCTALARACKTIQAAVIAAGSGDIINIAAGTYVEVGQIVINKDLTIAGASSVNTIIQPAQDTGNTGSGNMRGWFFVSSGVTFNLSNVTLDGSGKLVVIAILSYGNGTIESNVIKNISYTPSSYAGRGIQLYDTNMTIRNNTLQNIGRIGIFAFGAGVTSAVIDGNNYIGKGIGDWLDYGIELGGGAVATITNNSISNNVGVAYDGSSSAGILVTTYFATGTAASIMGNTISDSTDGIIVGYDANDTSVVTAHGNQFVNNGSGIYSTKPTVDATGNWWGDVSGPGVVGQGTGDEVSANVNFKPWCTNSACTTFSSANAVTLDATNISQTDATLNAKNGSYGAAGHSLWVSRTPFVTNSPNLPSGVYSTPDMGSIAANAGFSATLSSLTVDAIISGGAHSAMPAITPNTTYYYVAWSMVGGTWYPGQMMSFITTPMSIPTLTSPMNGVIMNGAVVTQSWATADTDIDHYIYESYNDSEAKNLRWHQELPATSKTATNVADTSYWWRVKAVDNAGNVSEWSELWKITIDNTKPIVPTSLLTAGGKNVLTNGYTNSKTFTYNLASSADTTRYQLKYWNDVTGSSFKESTPRISTNLSATGVYSDEFAEGEGKHYFAFSACDAANNCSEYSSPFVVTYDKTAPVSIITAPGNDETVSGSVVISGIVTDVNPHHYYMVIKNSANAVVAGPGTVNSATVADYNWDTTGLPDGEYTIRLESRDSADNKGTASTAIIQVTVDNTKPAIKNIGLSDSVINLSDVNPTLTADLSDVTSKIASAQYRIKDSTDAVVKKWTTLIAKDSSFDSSNESIDSIIDTSTLSDGTYKLYVRTYDEVGNVRSTNVSFTIDRTNPVVAITSPIDGASFGNNSIVSVLGTIDDAVDYELFIDGLSVGTGATFAGYDWDTAGVASGDYIIRLEATDASGNMGFDEATVTIDNTAPTITNTGNVVDENKIAPTITADGYSAFSWAADPSNPVGATFDDELLAPVFTVTNSGDYAFTLTAVDEFGNETTSEVTFAYVAPEPAAVIRTRATAPVAVAPIANGSDATEDEGEVLGTQTEKVADIAADTTSDNSDVKGDSDTNNDGALLGLSWYWWLLIGSGILGSSWWALSGRKNG